MARRAAAAVRSSKPTAAADGDSISGSVSDLDTGSSTNGSRSSSGRSDAVGVDSVVGAPLHQLRQAAHTGAGRQAAFGQGSCVGEGVMQPLHAYSDQVLLVQVEQLTLAAPAAPVLLQQMQDDLRAVADGAVPVAGAVPFWMQDVHLVQQLIDGSNSVVGSSCTPASAPDLSQQQSSQQQAQPQQQQAAHATAGTAGGAVSSSAVAQQQGSRDTHEIQPHTAEQVAQPGRRSKAMPISMRHGILLLPEDASLTLTAAPPAPSLRSLLSTTAVKQWFKRQVAKVTARRLVIRPGETQSLAAAAAARRARLAAARPAAGAAGSAAAAAATLDARQAAAAGLAAAGSGAVVLAAYCLLDFRGLELLAGRMQRVHVPGLSRTGTRSSSHGLPGASSFAGGMASSPAAPRASGGTLTGLTHMIMKTSVRAAVHEFIRPAAIAAAAAAVPAAAAGPGTASVTATALPAAPAGCNVVALAASDGLALQLSGWSYQYLMDMVHGNLMYHQSSFEPHKAAGPSRPQHTTFNPNVKFGPSAGQLPYFALTLSSCSVQVRPCWWDSVVCYCIDLVVRTFYCVRVARLQGFTLTSGWDRLT